MDRPPLSLADVREFGNRYERFIGQKVGTLPLLLAMSGDVLKHYLGKQWVIDNVFERSPLDAHLTFGPEDGIERYQFSDRVVALAEMLFHFQLIEGIETRLGSLSTSSVETSVSELEGAKFLFTSGIPFRFNAPTNQRGLDFDATIEKSGAAINCEMKCKVVGTELGVSTIANTLKTARQQVPRNEAALVFLKIPEAWVRQPNVGSIVGEALSTFFRGTKRVAAVLLHWEEWYYGPGPLRARATKFRIEYNPDSPFAAAIRCLGLQPPGLAPPQHQWTHFVDLLR
jgi:hypothetical protein